MKISWWNSTHFLVDALKLSCVGFREFRANILPLIFVSQVAVAYFIGRLNSTQTADKSVSTGSLRRPRCIQLHSGFAYHKISHESRRSSGLEVTISPAFATKPLPSRNFVLIFETISPRSEDASCFSMRNVSCLIAELLISTWTEGGRATEFLLEARFLFHRSRLFVLP